MDRLSAPGISFDSVVNEPITRRLTTAPTMITSGLMMEPIFCRRTSATNSRKTVQTSSCSYLISEIGTLGNLSETSFSKNSPGVKRKVLMKKSTVYMTFPIMLECISKWHKFCIFRNDVYNLYLDCYNYPASSSSKMKTNIRRPEMPKGNARWEVRKFINTIAPTMVDPSQFDPLTTDNMGSYQCWNFGAIYNYLNQVGFPALT